MTSADGKTMRAERRKREKRPRRINTFDIEGYAAVRMGSGSEWQWSVPGHCPVQRLESEWVCFVLKSLACEWF